ncbi:HAD family hydrolase [Demequina lutea]|uniref:FMN phosphatase YigB (HAD superfamily) n=1 Tax=Demequina lutea TaxID=431489 RepID=A0A7Y9ZAM9_9MICO|nr:HAD family hydrolase [Demequina lutea]NYI41073.1 FMN phosphatase YigB (HAD superfamily) [Demequina lutea]
MSTTVIFDFDGTLTVGSGPVDAYAGEVAALVGDQDIVAAVAAHLASFEAGESEFIDGYDVVRHVAHERGVSGATLTSAYERSRERLATESVPITAPDGLAEFLEDLLTVADVVLATNAPATRLPEALEMLGVSGVLTSHHTSVGKPDGLSSIVADAMKHGRVLSVGDVYANDLEPAAARGASTALVGPTWRTFSGQVTMAARTLPELYLPIKTWAGILPPAPPVPTGTGPTHERHH